MSRRVKDMILISAGLVFLSLALNFVHWIIYRDLKYITHYFLLHLSFLPIHALVIGLIIEELVSYRENAHRQRKLNLFLGIFFRQIGTDFLIRIADMLDNRKEFDELIVVGEDWKARRFRKARNEVKHFTPRMKASGEDIIDLMELLKSHEEQIMSMTRNPLVLEFETLHGSLMSLFHLTEEMHFRQPLYRLEQSEVNHLARDAGKSLTQLAVLWLFYMEHLKDTHPSLFQCRTGVCTMIQPYLLEDRE